MCMQKCLTPYINVNTSLISLKNIVEIIKYSIDKKKSGILHLSAPDEISYLDIGDSDQIVWPSLPKSDFLYQVL